MRNPFKRRIPRARIELYSHGKGWRYRVKSGNNKIVGASEEALKQYVYALRRARKTYPGLPAYKVVNDKLVYIPEPEVES